LRRDHRPYYVKQFFTRLQTIYVKRYLRPHFDALGENSNFMKPQYVEVFGAMVHLGDHVSVMASKDHRVRFSVWTDNPAVEGIFVGDACLISPGVRISAGKKITIGNSCMIASGVYIADSDWHGHYDRVAIGHADPVVLEDNVWVGDNAIVCKGVTIGKNSIIGARSVVLHDIPENVIAAGNPAKPIRELDKDKEFFTRLDWYEDADALNNGLALIDKSILQGNTFWGWLRYVFFPRVGD